MPRQKKKKKKENIVNRATEQRVLINEKLKNIEKKLSEKDKKDKSFSDEDIPAAEVKRKFHEISESEESESEVKRKGEGISDSAESKKASKRKGHAIRENDEFQTESERKGKKINESEETVETGVKRKGEGISETKETEKTEVKRKGEGISETEETEKTELKNKRQRISEIAETDETEGSRKGRGIRESEEFETESNRKGHGISESDDFEIESERKCKGISESEETEETESEHKSERISETEELETESERKGQEIRESEETEEIGSETKGQIISESEEFETESERKGHGISESEESVEDSEKKCQYISDSDEPEETEVKRKVQGISDSDESEIKVKRKVQMIIESEESETEERGKGQILSESEASETEERGKGQILSESEASETEERGKGQILSESESETEEREKGQTLSESEESETEERGKGQILSESEESETEERGKGPILSENEASETEERGKGQILIESEESETEEIGKGPILSESEASETEERGKGQILIESEESETEEIGKGPILSESEASETEERGKGQILSEIEESETEERGKGPILSESEESEAEERGKGQILSESEESEAEERGKGPILSESEESETEERGKGPILSEIEESETEERGKGPILSESEETETEERGKGPILIESEESETEEIGKGPILSESESSETEERGKGQILSESEASETEERGKGPILSESEESEAEERGKGQILSESEESEAEERGKGPILSESEESETEERGKGPILSESEESETEERGKGPILSESEESETEERGKGPILSECEESETEERGKGPILSESEASETEEIGKGPILSESEESETEERGKGPILSESEESEAEMKSEIISDSDDTEAEVKSELISESDESKAGVRRKRKVKSDSDESMTECKSRNTAFNYDDSESGLGNEGDDLNDDEQKMEFEKSSESEDQSSDKNTADEQKKFEDSKEHYKESSYENSARDRSDRRKHSERFKDAEGDDEIEMDSCNSTDVTTESESRTESSASERKENTVRTEYGKRIELKIDGNRWMEIKPDKSEKLLKSNWTNVFAEAFIQQVPGCVLKFHYHRLNESPRRKANYFNAKASCKNSGCGVFRFTISNKPKKGIKEVTINVIVVKPIVKHKSDIPKKRKLSMRNRQKMKKKLQNATASTMFYSEFGRMTDEEVKEGNYTKCQTEQVLRKAKSEWHIHDALHQDPFTELVLSHEIYKEEDEESISTKGYIQEISYHPFMAVLFMELSVETAKHHIKYGNGVFYLDATGSIVKKIHQDRKVLYYSLVIRPTDGVTVPVLEYLTDHQGTNYITRPLLTFQGLLGQKHRPRRIEVDFSWALIHSVLLSFNCMRITEYLNLCFEQGKEMKPGVTVVHVCCVHMLRAVRERLKEKVKDKAMRELLLRLWALLQNTKSVHQARNVWRVMCIVFASRYQSRNVGKGIKAMNAMVKLAAVDNLDDNICLEENQSNLLPAEDKAQKTGIRENSPYRQFFQVIVEEEEGGQENNPYYNKEILHYLSKNYMPLFPLWSGCFLEEDKTRDSNAPVEAWMKVLKKDIFQGARNIRVGRFVRTLKPVLKGRLRKGLGDTTRNRKKSKVKQKKPKETWQKRQRGKTRTSFFYSPPKEIPVPKTAQSSKKNPWKESRKTSEHKPAGKGLKNVSNTCWLTAALQGMAALTGLSFKGKDPVSVETQKVLSVIRKQDVVKGKALNPKNLREAIYDNLPNFTRGTQEDSAEFIHYLMEKNGENGRNDFTFDMTYTKNCLQCHKKSARTDNSSILNVEVPVRKEVSVSDCLEEHCKGEVIRAENAIYCTRCNERTAHETTAKLEGIQKGLIVLVKRFHQDSNGHLLKNTRDLRINSSSGTQCESELSESLTVRRSSFISVPNITFVMDDEMKLRKCDDTEVGHVRQSALSSYEVMQSSYVLFYGEMTQPDVKLLLSQCTDVEIAKCGDISLTGADLKTLLPDKWLNDQVVNAYMKLLTSGVKDLSVLDVFFFNCLVIGQPPTKFIKKAMHSRKLLVPALYNNHWTLMVVDMSKREILVFDSAENENRAAGDLLRKFLERQVSPGEKKMSYRLKFVQNVPKQIGFADCGVFMLQFAVCVVKEKELFQTNDILRFRRKMTFELLSEKLL